MKKQLFSALCLLMLCMGMKAQTNLANYTFAKSAGTYVPLAAGASTYLATWDSSVSGSIPLGGTFTFGAVTYTACYISSNGFIAFGAAPGTTNITPMSTLGSTSGAISAYGQDGSNSTVAGSSPLISYMNIGGATGEFVVQFQDHANYFNQSVERLNFQIRLNLATGAVNIVYGSWTAPGTSTSGSTAQIGIRGNTTTWNTNVNNLTAGNIPAGTTCSWSDAVTGSVNNSSVLFSPGNTAVVPSNGLTFTWAPPVAPVAPVRAFAAVTATTVTSANLAWTAPAGATQYNIQYRIPGTCAWTNFSGNPVMTPSVSLTGLTQSTVYQVRVQSSDATNNAIWSHIPDAAGTGDGYSTAGTFRTLDPACVTPTAQATALTFGGITNAAVNGTFTPAAFSTTPSYLVIRTLGTAPNTPTNGVTYTTGASAPLAGTVVAVGTSSTFATTGLAGNTSYSYYIYTYSSVGCSAGPLYYTVSPLTGTVVTCPATPGTGTVSAITQTDFNLAWGSSVGGGGATVTYTVDVATNNTFASPVAGSPFVVTAPTSSVAVSGLTTGTPYFYRIKADNGCSSAYTSTASVTTLSVPCVAPSAQATGLTFGGVTSTVVNGTYTPVSASGYLVIRTLGTAPNTPTNGVVYTTGTSAPLAGTVVAVGTASTFATTGLTGNTNYSYYIYTYNNTGCSGGPMYNVTAPLTGTVNTCPAKPTAVTNTLVTTNSFNLTWTASAGGTTIPFTYSVEVTTDAAFTVPVAGSPFSLSAPTASLALTGLNPATTYYYRITADNGCNIGTTTSANVTTSAIPTDLQTTQLTAPAVNAIGCYASSIPVVIQIKNAGNTVLDFSTNNATLVTAITGVNAQTFTTVISTGTLAANATQNVTVTTTYNMSAAGVYTINASATLATPDANPSNNAMAVVTRTNAGPSPLPQLATFVGYTGSATSLNAAFPGWNEGSGAVTPAITSESSFTVTNSAAHTGLYGAAAKMNLYSNNNGWLISPKVVPTASHFFRYKAALVTYNATTATTFGSTDTVRAMISTNCGVTWAPLRTFNATTNQGLNGSTSALTEYSESLAAYAGQEIMVAIYARRGVSSSTPDIDIVIDDMEIASCFVPSAVTVTNTTISSADLSWTAPTSGTPNYVYEVRTSGAAGSGATGLATTGTVTAPSTSVTASGLSAITAYSVYVRSDCGGGDFSTWTTVKTFTTPPACPAPTTATVTNIIGTRAVATWTAGATETAWDVYYGPTPLTAPTATTVPTATVGTTPSYTMTPLNPTTGYAVYVRANCGVGNTSIWSAVRNFTTTVSCPAPTNVVISAITPTAAVATWTVGGAETSWFVKYSAPTTTVVASGTPSYTMTGLTPSTTYSIQVKGICGASDSSAYTTLKTFATLCQAPDVLVTGNSRCGIGTTTLMATSTNTLASIQWYTAPTGGAAVATGSVFVTPSIASNTTFYATSTGGFSTYNVGPATNATALSYYITNNWGITFDASAATTLASVAVYPGSAGTVTLSVQSNAAGATVFGTYVATFTAGDVGQKTVLPLNIPVPAGTGYKVMVKAYSSGFTGFHRETSPGLGFPYTAPNCPISVTSSEWGGTTTGTYYFFYDFVATAGCESSRTAVTASVTAPPALSVSNSATLCANVISTVSVTSTASNYDSYVWSPVTNLFTDAAATVPYTGTSATTLYYKSATAGSTTYNVNASNSVSGCASIASTMLSTSIPVINASLSPTVVCSGAAVTLNATTNAITTGTTTFGSGATTTAASPSSPFNGAYGGMKAQYILRAADLIASGVSAGNITSLSINVTAAGATVTDFAISMGTTTLTAFGSTTDIQTGVSPVYSTASFVPVVGNNVFTFSTPFNWNGTSNIIVSTCWSNNNTSNTSTTVKANVMSYTSAQSWLRDSQNAAFVCGMTGTITTGGGSTSTTMPQFILGGQVMGQAAGAYTWQWNPGAINSNTATVNPVNPGTTSITATYTVTGTDPMTTCTNSAVVTVTVNPVPAMPTAVNSTQCGIAIPTASMSGGANYNWYATPTSTNVLQAGASSTFTTSIGTTTTFYVASYNANCESGRVALTASVTPADAVTATSTSTAICPGQSFTLTAASTNMAYSYTWTATPAAGSGIATSVTGATTVVMPITAGTYNYLVTAFDGVCTNTAGVQATLNAAPNVTTTNTMICVGSSAVLTGTATGIGAGSATIGTNSLTDYTGGPYRQGAGTDNKAQWLFTAAELSAANIAAGNITALSFNVPAGNANIMNNFSVRIGTTTATSLTTTFDASATSLVYGPSSVSAATGLNTYTFSVPFNWNGTSNIIIQVCHDVVSGGSSTSVTRQSISNRTSYSNTTGACAQTAGIAVAYRPVVMLAAQTSTNVASTMNWVWNPGSVSGNTISVSPPNTGSSPIVQVYTVTATNPVTSCTNSATSSVTVNPVPTVTLAASTSSICSGTTASLTASGATTYTWMPAGGSAAVAVVSPTANTVYTVTGTSLGCSSTQTVNLNVSTTPTVVASVSPTVICAGATVSLTASGAATYSWMPNGSTSGTTTATPTTSTTYTVSGTTAGCTNTKTLNVTVNNVPTLTVTTNPASGVLCTAGASATLTAAGTSTSYAWSSGPVTASISVAPTATTVYTVIGTNSCGVKTVTTSITVATTPTIAAMSSATVSCPGNPAVLTASATPGVTFSWNTTATTASITVTPTMTLTYTVTATNACGSAVATVVQNVIPCTGIEEVTNADGISIYPNPASDYVNIAVPASLASANTSLEVTDALGKLVIKENINTDVTTLRITELKEGVYFFKVISNNQTVKVGKVVKH